MIQITQEEEMETKKTLLENIVQKCIEYDKQIRSAKEEFNKEFFHKSDKSWNFESKLSLIDDEIRKIHKFYQQVQEFQKMIAQNASHLFEQQLHIKLQETKARLTRKSS